MHAWTTLFTELNCQRATGVKNDIVFYYIRVMLYHSVYTHNSNTKEYSYASNTKLFLLSFLGIQYSIRTE